ncbi:uncharacterized protein LOC129939966 isoform X2 [Eupeodes corollae]|uniref:uncharacterized protein LOC129939966 isoform X2 n=1 Tax=Eupeodes corollae TaxID=290404 RepID=UPI002491EBB9|nr:uncharacterized protein LOC129939966 isoform X2 [Eupeodes corollae]
MVGIDPSDIGKHQKLIKIAQEDMSQIDVLVCGRCLGVFHFVEEFKDHKRFSCDKETQIRDGPDTKPKIWAFLLWKATQINNKDNNNSSNNSSFNSTLNSSNNQQNSWALYQTWVKMEESIRETWIVAGKTIQSFAKMGHGGLQEMPVKITKTVVDNASNPSTEAKKPQIPQAKQILTNTKVPIITKKQHEEEGNDLSPIRNAVVKKPPLPVQQIPSKLVTSTPIQRAPLIRRAKRTIPNANGETEDEIVEKIVAKRFNPRRKMHEYLVKWESCSHEHNTWEPQVHLENVPQILETFEKQLARQKEQRAAQQAKQQAASLAAAIKVVDLKKDVIKDPNKIEETTKMNLSSPGSDSSRLSRTSKNKAMDQVKQWCADEPVENNAPAGGVANVQTNTPQPMQAAHPVLQTSNFGAGSIPALKRKLDDSDFDESAMIGDEDLEEDLIPSHTVKRMKNGDTVSVRVETKNERAVESKIIKVNGSMKNTSATEQFSADVIITQDTNTSGVVKKAGFNGTTSTNASPKTEAHIRVVSKGETNSGIVRMGSEVAASLTSNVNENGPVQHNNQVTTQTSNTIMTPIHRPQVNKTLTSNPLSNIGNIQITQVQQSNMARSSSPRLINSQTTIARTAPSVTYHQQQQQQQQTRIQAGTPKTVQTNTRVLQSQPRTATIAQRKSQSPGIQQTSPTSGKMIIPRGKVAPGGNTQQQQQQQHQQQSAVARTQTPEQKILQLSKSGDLKVTKKVMSKETTSKQQQVLARHQSQVQIQKVQQIAPPMRHVGAPKQKQSQVKTAVMDVSSFNHEEHQQQALCPITGKILGQVEGTEIHEEQHHQIATMQSGVLQTQLLTTADQQHEQGDFQEMEQSGNLLQLADQQLMTNEDGSPLLVTGEDGTVYQVAGKNAEGQTILVAQGADGEQQFAYVAAAEGDENNVLTLDNAVAEAVAQLSPEQQAEALAAAAAESGQYILKQDDGTTGELVSMSEANEMNPAQQGQLCIQTGSESGESQDQNIPAEVVQADLPSPGGTRRVVLLLQDGTFMITQMQDDEYKSLNIAS